MIFQISDESQDCRRLGRNHYSGLTFQTFWHEQVRIYGILELAFARLQTYLGKNSKKLDKARLGRTGPQRITASKVFMNATL